MTPFSYTRFSSTLAPERLLQYFCSWANGSCKRLTPPVEKLELEIVPDYEHLMYCADKQIVVFLLKDRHPSKINTLSHPHVWKTRTE